MRIILLGTGTAIPFNGRAQTGILVDTGAGIYLFDCGSGVINNLSCTQYQPADIDAVFLTHLHPDHVNDIVTLVAARSLLSCMNTVIYGPEETEQCIANLKRAYSGLEKNTSQSLITLKADDEVTLSGVHIHTYLTRHGQRSSIGYRIECNNKVVVIPGDTAVTAQELMAADGADLLIHECSYPDGIDTPDHTTPSALTEALTEKNIKKIVLVHLYQETYEVQDDVLRKISEGFTGDVCIGKDMDIYEV
jgi:ribonuclease BN (tRNA processing enzyme)